ncbi:hypothetical protein FDP41_002147 [Naegleria fowleri]|uniref:Uncharacterized protein n=1 Tax=Naegleria fowleri TaxID=5763 RepID=A0A6A5BPQ9_NAEFO|nr:uncharacterized protein FDP41_002147 [Naegleria fowleri]KAF0979077.1 hypothetical protein FDP41_002147 [Naegleria fowleri]CAG4713105.1 unnamed protein product [Naegleria fowleri]
MIPHERSPFIIHTPTTPQDTDYPTTSTASTTELYNETINEMSRDEDPMVTSSLSIDESSTLGLTNTTNIMTDDHSMSSVRKSKIELFNHDEISECPPPISEYAPDDFETNIYKQEIIRTMSNHSNLQLISIATGQSLFRTKYNQLRKFCKFTVEIQKPLPPVPPAKEQSGLLGSLNEEVFLRIRAPQHSHDEEEEPEDEHVEGGEGEDDDDDYWIDEQQEGDDETLESVVEETQRQQQRPRLLPRRAPIVFSSRRHEPYHQPFHHYENSDEEAEHEEEEERYTFEDSEEEEDEQMRDQEM